MSIRPSSSTTTSLIEHTDDDHRCEQCDGPIGNIDGYRCCLDCCVTPNGNFIDTEKEVQTNTIDLPTSVSRAKYTSTYYNNPYDDDKDYDTYNSYSVRAAKKREKMIGGYEAAYKDPSNGLEYCIAEEAMSNKHYDGPIIWD